MIRTTALLAGLTTLAASARVTHITILFKKLDKNNDGVLDKDEIPLETIQAIEAMDDTTDNDNNILSETEFTDSVSQFNPYFAQGTTMTAEDVQSPEFQGGLIHHYEQVKVCKLGRIQCNKELNEEIANSLLLLKDLQNEQTNHEITKTAAADQLQAARDEAANDLNGKQSELDNERAAHSTTKTTNQEEFASYKEEQHRSDQETAKKFEKRLTSAKENFFENLTDQKKAAATELANEKKEHAVELNALKDDSEQTLAEKVTIISTAHESTITLLKQSFGAELTDVKSDAALELATTKKAAATAAATAAAALEKEMKVQKTTIILLSANMKVTVDLQKKLDATRQELNLVTDAATDAKMLALREKAALMSRLHVLGANVKHLHETLTHASEDYTKLLSTFIVLAFVLWFFLTQVSSIKKLKGYDENDDELWKQRYEEEYGHQEEEEEESEEEEEESEEE